MSAASIALALGKSPLKPSDISRRLSDDVSRSSSNRVSPLSSPFTAGALRSTSNTSLTGDSTLSAKRPLRRLFSKISPLTPLASSFTRARTSARSTLLMSKRSGRRVAGSVGAAG